MTESNDRAPSEELLRLYGAIIDRVPVGGEVEFSDVLRDVSGEFPDFDQHQVRSAIWGAMSLDRIGLTPQSTLTRLEEPQHTEQKI